jgi:adenosylmethionine-8-amino-7-oxononanoate aminotransferase
MPMILLSIRVEMEVILKMNYSKFLENKTVEELCMRLVNGVITELLDSNIFYSRLSFLESGKEAIDIKAKNAQLGNSKSSTDKKQKFYTRSALVKNLIPMPSEGKVRALFTDG